MFCTEVQQLKGVKVSSLPGQQVGEVGGGGVCDAKAKGMEGKEGTFKGRGLWLGTEADSSDPRVLSRLRWPISSQ